MLDYFKIQRTVPRWRCWQGKNLYFAFTTSSKCSHKSCRYPSIFHCSTAYKNISDAVLTARELAAQARQTAIESENELYPKQGESIIEKSTQSLKSSQKIHQASLKEIERMEGKRTSFSFFPCAVHDQHRLQLFARN